MPLPDGPTSLLTTSLKLEPTDDHPQKKSPELLLDPDVNTQTTVCVFPDALSPAFYVHRSILYQFSPYFRSQLHHLCLPRTPKKFISSKTGVEVWVKLPPAIPTIKLPKNLATTKEVFTVFVKWLYGATLVNDSQCSHDPGLLIQLWVFAQRTGVPACQNACIEEIEKFRQTNNSIQTEWIPWVYSNTEEGCGMRKLLVDQCTFLDKEWFRLHDEQFPKIFLLDLAYRMRGLQMQSGNCPLFSKEERRKAYHVLRRDDSTTALRDVRYGLCRSEKWEANSE